MTPHFDDLIDDILVNILSTLPHPDILNARLVSKRLENVSRENSVWHDVFEREVIASGKPCPGFSHASSPLLTGKVVFPSSTPASGITTPQENSTPSSHPHYPHASSDLENRTKHALRLEQRWKKKRSDDTGIAMTITYELPEAVDDVLLLRGGRFSVTVHSDRLNCWDLGFPDAGPNSENCSQTARCLRCVDEWRFSAKGTHSVMLDADTPVYWRAAEIGRIAIVRNSNTLRNQVRTCTILSARCSSTMGVFGEAINESYAHPGLFRQEAVIKLPAVLPPPSCRSGDDRGEPSSTLGKLGKLIHVHGNLLFFDSFSVDTPFFDDASSSDSEEEAEPTGRFTGIEVINISASSSGKCVSALLDYPDSRQFKCFDVHVHESSEHIVVIWGNIVALYPIHDYLTCSELDYGRSPRIVLTASTLIALTEELRRPITFTTCRTQGQVSSSKERAPASPEPLTILARSADQPYGLIQRVLFAIKEPSTSPSEASTLGFEYKFMLMRIPVPTPPQFESVHAHFDDAEQSHMYGVQHLVLGPSGRGVRVDAGGAVFRCAPTSMILPGWYNSVMGLLTTVDFWPHAQSDTLPIPFTSEADQGVQTSWSYDQHGLEAKVRFDDGMGRLIATHTLRPGSGGLREREGDAGSAGGQGGRGSLSRSVLTVMDFA